MAAQNMYELLDLLRQPNILSSLKQMFVGGTSAQIDLGQMAGELSNVLCFYEKDSQAAAHNEHFASECKKELLRVLPLFYQEALEAGSIELIVKPTEWVNCIRDQQLITAVLPFVEDAFSQPNTTPDSLGRLACSYLNMGGRPETLIAPLTSLLDTTTDAEEMLRQLCCAGFIDFLNHSRVQGNEALKGMLSPFAGAEGADGSFPALQRLIFVVVSVDDSVRGFVWKIGCTGNVHYASVVGEGFSAEFNSAQVPQEVIAIAGDLFAKKLGGFSVGAIPLMEESARREPGGLG